MSWNVYFFETKRGERIVKEFIKNLQEETSSKIFKGIDLLKVHGPFLGMPYSKRLTNEIHELRIRGKQEIRILYSFSRNNVHLLHGFKKQTQKTPKNEIKIAEIRKKIVDNV